ncbi:hypothetical protein MTsPCn9_26820 [Croceitalea sp. MTPC9]|uniref:hypothetical protein n=1 Tax=unclassified Croceitalea TaxID=2632280 RepID=UPI002B374A38|nr:hypothetical protein MTsPCn6_23360 [Croceitalea sp. MTPC6]GMN17744.1 hypothetical protein MTsPCn9_26820 [Croceitalea sp. MTPC9]
MENSTLPNNRGKGAKILVVVLLSLLAVGFLDNQIMGKKRKFKKSKIVGVAIEKADFKFWTWITADEKRTNASYTEDFKKFNDYGFDVVLINTGANAELLKRLTPLAKKEGLEVHAWIFTNRVNQSLDKRNIDTVLPVIYDNFSNKELDWTRYAELQGVNDLKGKNPKLCTKLYIPDLSPQEFEKAILMAKANGAECISIFDSPALSERHFAVVKKLKSKM